MKKIIISGGHPTPAFSLIDEIIANNAFDIVFVGRKYAIDSERTLSYEFKECQRRKIHFIELHAGKLTRIASRSSLVGLLRIPIGFISALLILLKERPSLIMSFGGYLALPLAWWGKILSIPVFTHEQTMKVGAANRLIASFSDKVYTAFEEAQSEFPSTKTQWIGNPVRKTVFEQKPLSFTCDESVPMLYVTGGSLGSHSINVHIFTILESLVKKYTVIHQLGDIKEYGDFDTANKLRKKLQSTYPGRYIPVSHISEDDIGSLYAKSSLVIGRAGANTFFELIMVQKPAIFIPLPWSANGEQRAHAQFFQDNGIGILFDQKRSSDELLKAIEDMYSQLGLYQKHFKALPLQFKHDAAQKLLEEIRKTI